MPNAGAIGAGGYGTQPYAGAAGTPLVPPLTVFLIGIPSGQAFGTPSLVDPSAAPATPGWKVEISFDAIDIFTPGTWTDITAYVDFDAKLRLRAGRTDERAVVEPSECEFTIVDHDRRFDPTNLAGPYANQLIPRRPLRVSRVHGAMTHVHCHGYVSRWPQRFDRQARVNRIPIRSLDLLSVLAGMSVRAADPFTLDDAVLSELDVNMVLADPRPYRDRERSGARIAGLLDEVGIPTTHYQVDPGMSVLLAHVLDTDDLLDYLRRIEATELGLLFVNMAGILQFHERLGWSQRPLESVSQLTFSDNLADANARYVDVERDDVDIRLILNDVTRGVTGGDEVRAIDRTSIAKFGELGDSKTDLLFDSMLDAQDQCDALIDRYADSAATRFRRLIFHPESDPDRLWNAITYELGTRITVKHQPGGVGTELVGDFWIDGIEIVTDGLNTEVAWSLAAVDPTDYFTLDDAVLSELDDENVLAY